MYELVSVTQAGMRMMWVTGVRVLCLRHLDPLLSKTLLAGKACLRSPTCDCCFKVKP